MPAPLEITVTNAGRAAIVNAQNTGTAPVTISQIGLSATAVVPGPGATTLNGEFKRVAGVAGEVVADDTIHITLTDGSSDAYALRSIALYLANGTLFAIYGQATPILEKTAQSIAAMSLDVIFADIAAAAIAFGDANFTNPPATTERQGVVELTTLAEAQAGIDALRALTPATAKAAILGWILAQDGAGSGLDADLLDGQDGSFYTNIVARLGYTPWGPNNDGSGSGLDADLLAGQSSSFYTNIVARLGYTPLNSTAYSAADVKAKLLTVDGAGSGLDADLLDGQDGGFYSNIVARLGYTPLNKAGDSVTGTITFQTAESQGIAARPGSASRLEVLGNGTGAAVITLHRPGAFATFLGLDTDNQLKLGGWSLGAAAHLIWHSGNDGSGSGLDADLVDGWQRDDIRHWNNLLGKPFNWAGQSGQPQWLWGSNDGSNYYVWNPSNFNVNYANVAGGLVNSPGGAPHYACRAWVNFNGTGAVAIRSSGNVSSITDLGIGRYRVNFATAMPDANYAAVGNCTQFATGTADPRRAALPLIRDVTASDFIINTMGVQDADVWLDAAQVMIQVAR